MVRSALMLSAPLYDNEEINQLIASPQEFESLTEAFNDSRIGGFGRVNCQKHKPTAEMKEAIARFFENRERMEILLLYMTGYELADHEGELYFADSHSDSTQLPESSIPAAYLQAVIGACAAERKMVVIDCFSPHAMSQDERDHLQQRLTAFSHQSGCIVLASQDTFHSIRGEEGQKNPGFTESLLQGLSTGKADLDQRGFITEEELFFYVFKEMSKYGTAPNLFFNSPDEVHRIKLARNVQFSNLPTFADEDDSLNLARFLRLLKLRRSAETDTERETLEQVIEFQPETTFLRRLLRAIVVICLFSLLGAWLTGISIGAAFTIAFMILFGLLADDFLRRKFS